MTVHASSPTFRIERLGSSLAQTPEGEAYAEAALHVAGWFAWLTDAFKSRENALNVAAFIASIGFYVSHFAVVWTRAVDVPIWDEWTMLTPDSAIAVGPTWEWLLAQHNEHRIVFTKLLVWLQHVAFGWDVRVSQAINYVLFGGLLAYTAWTVKRWASTTPWWVVLLFVGFLQSTLNHENHSWGFQSPFHLTLLFFLAGANLLFDKAERIWTAALAVACFGISMFSMASGLASAAVACGLYLLAAGCGIVLGDRSKRRALAARAALFAAGMTLTAFAMLHDYRPPQHGLELPMPWTRSFQEHFLNLVSLGFGVERSSWGLGLICLALATAPVIVTCLTRRLRLDANHLAVIAGWGGVLAILASVSVGRAMLGADQAKSARYVEYAVLLLPFAAAAWQQNLAKRPIAARIGLIALWLAAVIGYHNNWSFSPYRNDQRSHQYVIEILQQHMAGHPTCLRNVHPAPHLADEMLALGSRENLPFCRRIALPTAPPWGDLTRVSGANASLSPPSLIAGAPGKSPLVEFSGWSADDVDPQHVRPGASSFIVLNGPKGEIVLPCAPALRPDVSQHYRNDSYEHTGVWAGIEAPKLPPGDYRVVMRTVRDNGVEYFEHVHAEAVFLPPKP